MSTQLKTVLWEVDAQRDFMLPGGALYVPGGERIIPNLQRLVRVAREGRALLVSSADQHAPDDPEFKNFPPHCVKGTPGAELIPEARTDKICTIPNDPSLKVPDDLLEYQQVLLEKQTLDVFQNPHAAEIVERLGSETEFLVFGVVTEYCVGLAAKGLLERKRQVAIITDAIETLNSGEGQKTVLDLCSAGARLMTTEEALEQKAFSQ